MESTHKSQNDNNDAIRQVADMKKLSFIMFLQFLIILFILYGPFADNPLILILYCIFIPVLMVKYATNISHCSIPHFEKFIRGLLFDSQQNLALKETFFAKLLDPIFTKPQPKMFNDTFLYLGLGGLTLMAGSRLFYARRRTSQL